MGESLDHNADKRVWIPKCMSELGVPTIGCELDHSDVVIAGLGGLGAIEADHFAKNTVRNVLRNHENGLRFTIVAAPSFAVLRDVANKLHKDLPQQLWSEVGICTLRTLELLAGITNTNRKE